MQILQVNPELLDKKGEGGKVVIDWYPQKLVAVGLGMKGGQHKYFA